VALAASPPVGPTARAAPAARLARPNDRAQIEALEHRFIAGFDARDVKAIMANYAPGDQLFVFDVVPPRQYVGWSAYKADWEALFRAYPGPVEARLAQLSVTVVGPVAYGHSIQTSALTGPNGAKSTMVMRVSDVYRKLGGRWKIVQEHVSVPVDLATGKADLQSRP